MMETYYEQDDDAKAKDARPEMFYQVGVTPERVELPRNHCARMAEEYEASGARALATASDLASAAQARLGDETRACPLVERGA